MQEHLRKLADWREEERRRTIARTLELDRMTGEALVKVQETGQMSLTRAAGLLGISRTWAHRLRDEAEAT